MTPIRTVLNLLLLAALAGPAAAAFTPQATAVPGSAPQGINYQGRLEDNNVPVNGVKTMVFRVFDAATGGSALWTSPSQPVSVNIGLFNAVVPVPITALVGGGSRYLEVQIDGTVMSPRELMNSVPYALIAKSVEGTIDASTSAFTINANSSASQPALHVSSLTGNVGVGTGSPGTAFDVGGAAQFGSGAVKSTFTAGGSLNVPFAVNAGSANFSGGLTASSGTFTASGNTQFSILAASGVFSAAGGYYGTFFGGNSMLLTGGARVVGASVIGPGSIGDGTLVVQSTSITSGNPVIAAKNLAGTELFRVQQDGRVGVLNVAPSVHLDVTGNARLDQGAGAYLRFSRSNAEHGYIGGASPLFVGAATDFGVRAESNLIFGISSTERMRLSSAGRLGIATSDPAALLDVNGAVQFGSGATKSTFTATADLLLGGTLDVSPSGARQVLVSNTASAVNYVQMTGATTGNRPAVSAQGSDTNVSLELAGKGSGQVGLTSNGAFAFTANGVAGGVNRIEVNNAAAGAAPQVTTNGSDANVHLRILPKGTGGVGIGTAGNPVEMLQVTGNLFMDSSGAGTTEIRGQRATLSLANTADISIRADSDNDTSGVIRFEKGTSGAPTEFARIGNTGSVGIGSVNPASKLHMSSGTLTIDGNAANSIETVGNVSIGAGASPSGRLDVRVAATAEATLIARFTDSTPTPMVQIFAGNDGTAENAANAVLKVKRASSTLRSINAAGSINASGADYAEWILWPKPHPAPGAVVRHKGTYMIVSSIKTAAFIGNDLYKEGDAILLTFMGQVPVKVRGKVKEGDYLIPNGDGTASAVAREKATFAQYREAVGVAWESSDDPGLKTVLAAVGVK